jgi:hypothetical protein
LEHAKGLTYFRAKGRALARMRWTPTESPSEASCFTESTWMVGEFSSAIMGDFTTADDTVPIVAKSGSY